MRCCRRFFRILAHEGSQERDSDDGLPPGRAFISPLGMEYHEGKIVAFWVAEWPVSIEKVVEGLVEAIGVVGVRLEPPADEIRGRSPPHSLLTCRWETKWKGAASPRSPRPPAPMESPTGRRHRSALQSSSRALPAPRLQEGRASSWRLRIASFAQPASRDSDQNRHVLSTPQTNAPARFAIVDAAVNCLRG